MSIGKIAKILGMATFAPGVGLFTDKRILAKAGSVVMHNAIQKIVHEHKGTPEYGDVIFCKRKLGIYRHFGIYIGNQYVIHFAPESGDIGDTAVVHRTTLKLFADGDEVYVMDFPEHYQSRSLLKTLVKMNDYQLQTPRQTVERARSLLGQKGVKDKGYELLFNNCEHFAIWCKTNVAESKQVSTFVDNIWPF